MSSALSLSLGCGFLYLLLGGCNPGSAPSGASSDTPAPDNTVALCHARADGTFVLQHHRPEDLPAHLLHGDGLPTGPVPGRADQVFDATCRAVADTGTGPCPPGMAHIAGEAGRGGFCIDRWEAHLAAWSPYEVPASGIARTAPGVIPQGYISGDVAEAACRAAGKRLCTSSEWLRACQGPRHTTYPYGTTYLPGACNEGRPAHPVLELFGDATDWSPAQMNDPRLNQLPDTVDPTGSNPVCQSAEGVFDLHGNLHEWVADAEGTFRGGFYVDARINGEGCLYRTTAHSRTYHDYSTGFRCCTDAR